jgi:hypothetical protein
MEEVTWLFDTSRRRRVALQCLVVPRNHQEYFQPHTNFWCSLTLESKLNFTRSPTCTGRERWVGRRRGQLSPAQCLGLPFSATLREPLRGSWPALVKAACDFPTGFPCCGCLRIPLSPLESVGHCRQPLDVRLRLGLGEADLHGGCGSGPASCILQKTSIWCHSCPFLLGHVTTPLSKASLCLI